MSVAGPYQIELFPLANIHPTEDYSPSNAETLRTEIEITGLWTHPLLVDRERGALMDGHHRYHAARSLGLTCVPVIRLSYDDPAVELKSWRPNQSFTPQDIWTLIDCGQLLPMKSTRHVLQAQLPFSRVPLAQLHSATNTGQAVPPAAPHLNRVQILTNSYHSFGARMALRTVSAANLDLETADTLVPHDTLRRALQGDPALAALLPAAPCRIALGQQQDFPFRLTSGDLLLLPPSLLDSIPALAAVTRWGMEAAFARQTGQPDAATLAALLRHGAALIATLHPNDRGLLLGHPADTLPPALMALPQTPPSDRLLQWMADRLGCVAPASPAPMVGPLPLEAPVETVLVSNSDSRLRVDPVSGKNIYGTTPRPRPEAVHFSSSTASSISSYGFLYCDVLRRDLLSQARETGQDLRDIRSDLCQAIVQELCALCAIPQQTADGIIAPSGTDTELLAVLLARAAAPQQRLVNILISPAETGRGIKLAGAGLYFDGESATGLPLRKGTPVWDGAKIDLVEIALRDDQGRRLAAAEINAAFLAAGRAALASGARVLAHVLIGSKTGLNGPSRTAVDLLCAEAPDQVDVVVDACQMRMDYTELGQCLARGWMLQVSGSKSLTGPPFSGALMIPTRYRNRAETARDLLRPSLCYPEDWNGWWAGRMGRSDSLPDFGAPLRWLPALLETKLLQQVPQALRDHALNRFRQEVETRLSSSPFLNILPREDNVSAPETTPTATGGFARHSIVAFQLMGHQGDGRLVALDEPHCRRVFELLNRDASTLVPAATAAERAVLRQEFHIGQPVVLGHGPYQRTVLRLVIGMRFYNIVAHAGPGAISAALESEISDLLGAISKLEILAQHWWSYHQDLD